MSALDHVKANLVNEFVSLQPTHYTLDNCIYIDDNTFIHLYEEKSKVYANAFVKYVGESMYAEKLSYSLSEKSQKSRIKFIEEYWIYEAKQVNERYLKQQHEIKENIQKSIEKMNEFKNAFGGDILHNGKTLSLHNGLVFIKMNSHTCEIELHEIPNVKKLNDLTDALNKK